MGNNNNDGNGSSLKVGFALFHGEDFKYDMQNYSIMLVLEKQDATIDLCSLAE